MKKLFNYTTNIFLFFTLLQIIFSSTITAQNKYDIKQFLSESGTIIKQPLNWERNDWFIFAGIAGLTYGTMFVDKDIKFKLNDNQKYANSFPIQFGKYWGEPVPTLTIGLGLYGYGYLSDDVTAKKIGYEIGQSAFWSGVITQIFKFGFGRERPRHSDDPFSFHPFSFKDDNFLALNSGHTALAFSLSTVLAANTDKTYLKIIAFTPAFLTAFSRVYHNEHWTSDVILGAVVGYAVGSFVSNLHLNIQVNAATINSGYKQTNLFLIRIPI